jgi:hypothetical protein
MSLTSLLKAGTGPVREWFEANFPETQRVCTDANRELRGGAPAKTPCAVAPVPGTDHAMVGTTVGYVLSAHLREDALQETVAMHAAALLVRPLGPRAAPQLVERAVVARTHELKPWLRSMPAHWLTADEQTGHEPADARGTRAGQAGPEWTGEEWTEFCQLMCILTRFEQFFRAGPSVLAHLVPPLIAHGQDLHALAGALVSPPTLQDVKALGRATVEDHGSIRYAKELFIDPTFAQSLALGGADADVVYDGTLMDLKSSAQAGVVGRLEAWQLLGYLFADTDDVCHIERVGFAALRRRRTLIWPAQELIDALAGRPSAGVEQWRAEFAAVLRPLAEAHAARRAERMQAQVRARLTEPETGDSHESVPPADSE